MKRLRAKTKINNNFYDDVFNGNNGDNFQLTNEYGTFSIFSKRGLEIHDKMVVDNFIKVLSKTVRSEDLTGKMVQLAYIQSKEYNYCPDTWRDFEKNEQK